MYIVEGNTGVGKSTFLKILSKYLPEVSIGLEPINSWHGEEYGQSLLANFYTDTKRWAYTMETIAMTRRVYEHLKDQEDPNPLRIVERSIYSGHYCFALNGYAQGYFSEVEWQVYLSVFNFLIPGRCKPPLGFIYLRAEPEKTFERIKKRNRSAEASLSLDYQELLFSRHEDFLIHKKNILPELAAVPVLVLDCSVEFEHDEAIFQGYVEKVRAFIEKTCPQQSKESFLKTREVCG